jgi:HEAT repeat protein
MLVAPIVVALSLAPAQVKEKAPPPPPAPAVRIKLAKTAIAPARAVPPPGLPGVGGASDGVGGPGEESVLKAAKLATTDQALLDFFRKRTPPAPPPEHIGALVKKLSGADLDARDAAQAELTTLGFAAVPPLYTAANNVDDAEASRRAREVLAITEGSGASNLVTHAARLLAARKPAGAAEALIGYLPFAEDESAFLEVETALVAVAVHDRKPDPALLRALTDKLAVRRGAAAHVICQAGGSAYHAAIRPLLKDARASVRLRAALGLVGAYDAEAIPVLIDLLEDLTPRLRNQAEEYLTQLAGEWAVAGPKGNDLMSRQLRRDVWAAWWKNTDGSRLLDEFRSRTLSDEELARLTALVAKLGDDKPAVRDAAMADLLAAGKSAAPLLRRAVNDNDPKTGALAARCMETIEKDALASPMPSAAARLLGLRRPPGTVETLLAYLPCCESADALEQFVDILAAVGCPGGSADLGLVKALEDRIPSRRAAAAMALCRGKALPQMQAVRKLLSDPDLDVRLRAAQGLAQVGEKEAIPALIALLKELPAEQTWDVEEYLGQLAGDKAPMETLSADLAGRARAVEAWGRWWKENADKVDLTNGDGFRREAGVFTVVESWNAAFNSGRVLEVDRAGKVRWEIRNLQYPMSAQVLRGGNVLVVEGNTGQLTERDRSGKVVGINRVYPSLFYAERQRDGSTFLACRQHLYLLDPKGAVAFEHTYAMNSILAARRFRDGSIAYVSYGGHYVRLDRAGKEVKSVQLPNWGVHSPNGADILPGDRIVLAEQRLGKVIEYGLDGKVIWECPIRQPISPHALPNGNLLVSGDAQQSIYEIDRRGKIAREWKGLSFRPFRVARR